MHRRNSKRSPCSNDLVLAQRANTREADLERHNLVKLLESRRKRMSKLEEEMCEIREDLRCLKREVPEYFDSDRPASARLLYQGSIPIPPVSSTRNRRPDCKVKIKIPTGRHSPGLHNRPTTAPVRQGLGRPAPVRHGAAVSNSSTSLDKMAGPGPNYNRRDSLVRHDSINFKRQDTTSTINSLPAVPAKSGLLEKKAPGGWRKQHTRSKLNIVKVITSSHQKTNSMIDKRCQENPKKTIPELDKIMCINRWLSIQNVAIQPKGIPTVAMRYIRAQNKDWKFDLPTFLSKNFPETQKPAKSIVPDATMEKEKKNFNNFTAARALLKFKRTLAVFRAKTDEERAADKMWEALKDVRYLRIPGKPTEPAYMSYADIFK